MHWKYLAFNGNRYHKQDKVKHMLGKDDQLYLTCVPLHAALLLKYANSNSMSCITWNAVLLFGGWSWFSPSVSPLLSARAVLWWMQVWIFLMTQQQPIWPDWNSLRVFADSLFIPPLSYYPDWQEKTRRGHTLTRTHAPRPWGNSACLVSCHSFIDLKLIGTCGTMNHLTAKENSSCWGYWSLGIENMKFYFLMMKVSCHFVVRVVPPLESIILL